MTYLLNQQYGEYLGVIAELGEGTEKELLVQAMNTVRSSCVQVVFLGVGLGGSADKTLKTDLKANYLKLETVESVIEWANELCAKKSKEGLMLDIMGKPN